MKIKGRTLVEQCNSTVCRLIASIGPSSFANTLKYSSETRGTVASRMGSPRQAWELTDECTVFRSGAKRKGSIATWVAHRM